MRGGRPWRVAYLDHTAKWSGGEIALYRTLVALDRARVEPLVILAEEGEFATRLRDRGISVEVLPLAQDLREVRKDSLGRGFGGGLAYIGYAVRLARLLKLRKIDLVHCNSLKADIYGAVAGRLARVPVLWHVRDHIDPSYLPARVVAVFRTLAHRLPQLVAVNSESTLATLQPPPAPHPRWQVVYDGLMESELATPLPTPFSHWPRERPRIALLGRIVRWKGQHVFLEAARLLIERGVEAEFWIIGAPLFGEHDYEAECQRLAEPLGERVRFLGFRSDVAALLQQVDILAHCSISPEPFGQVVIEGMAQGLPVVASAGGGVCEILADTSCGVLTPMGDAAALADALERLLREPERACALGQAAHRRVREKFTAAQSARAVESLYHVQLG